VSTSTRTPTRNNGNGKVESQAAISKKALVALADLGGRTTTEDDVTFSGTKFILPETMHTLDQAIKFLAEKLREDEEEVQWIKQYRYRVYDGAHATAQAIRKAFGFTLGRATYSFFGKNPPQIIDIETGPDQSEQAPWGAMGVPGLEGLVIYLDGWNDNEYGHLFRLVARGPRKYRFHVEGLFRLVEEELRINSIYRGKAIDGQEQPKFLDLRGVNPAGVVYSEEVLAQLAANVWSPIQHAEILTKLGQPGKRAVLFEGPYGTGKTLAAYLTAQKAVEAGWTFLMCRPGRDNIETVLQTARIYQPSVVFFEDVDTLAKEGERERISRMLDMFDGMQSKGLQMLLVLTTNHVGDLHKGMLRPGRLDAIITMSALDQVGVERLTKHVLGEHLADDIDWGAVHIAMSGYMPAFVKEALDRAVRYAVVRGDGELTPISTEDMVNAAQGLRPQFELMHGAKEGAGKDALSTVLSDVVAKGLTEKVVLKSYDGGPMGHLASMPADEREAQYFGVQQGAF